MRWWKRVTRPERPPSGVRLSRPSEDPEPIAVFFHDGVAEGWVAPIPGRLSDALNAGRPLRVQLPVPDAPLGGWGTLDAGEVVAIAANPTGTASKRRIARRRHRIQVAVGPYEMTGVAYMPPAADPSRFAQSTSRRWLPLTQCTVESGENEWAVEVIVVNLDYARSHFG